MAEVGGSVLVQECLSRAISFVMGRREEKASQGANAERLEMAVSQLEFALERTTKLPITELSLLHRRKMIKRAYLEAMELLNKHKQVQAQALQEGQQEEEVAQAQGAKRSRWAVATIRRAKNNLSISSSSFAGLKTDDVRRFEWFADHAGKFVRDVESGCSLRHHTFCNPLVRLLLEGKTLRHQVLLQGSGRLRRRLYMQPICLEGRGVETVLIYQYRDHFKPSTPDKSFNLVLILRLSESTDLVGTAIVCLRWVASQFKVATTEAAMGELTLIPDVQYTSSHPHAPCYAEIDHESYGDDSQYLRPDPVCCREANMHGPCANSVFPEQVIHFFFRCSSSALDCRSLPSSSAPDNEPAAAGKRRRAPLDLTIGCLPHHAYKHKEQQKQQESCYALEINGDDGQERGGDSVAHGAETLRSKATIFFSRQPEMAEYRMLWIYRHGVAGFFLEKPGIRRSCAPKTRTSDRCSTSSRLAAACHRSMSLQKKQRSVKRERTEDKDQGHGNDCPLGPWAV